MELAARLAVLLACAAAAGALFVLFAAPRPTRHPVEPLVPPPMAGLAPTALGAFILLAGGTAISGAGMLDAGVASPYLAAAGIALLAATGLLAARSGLRVRRATSARDAAIVPSPPLIVLAWAGAALALTSWILAAGAVVVAALASVRVEPRRS